MVARGGVVTYGPGCNIAYKCQCGAYRWADTAEERGESSCIRCGRKFPNAPVRMPFCRKGPSSTPGGKEAASQADASKGKGKAAAKAKAQPKPKAQAAKKTDGGCPWERTPSATEAPSGETEIKLGAKKNDEVHKLDILIRVAKHFGDERRLQELEGDRRQALQEKAEKLPPVQRVAHLQKRHRLAGEELRRLLQAQAAMDEEFEELKKRRLDHHELVENQREVVEALRGAVEQAEMEVPPTGTPKPVGRQAQPGNQGDLKALLKGISFEAPMDEATDGIAKASGGQAPDVINRRTVQGVDLLTSALQESEQCKKEAVDQEAADRRAALQLHKKLNWQGFEAGDKRGREACVDGNGDETMEEEPHVQNGGEATAEGPWQTAGRKKGKGRSGPAAQEAASSSGTVPQSSGRDRSPRRPRVEGTPARGTESGTLQQSEEKKDGAATPLILPRPPMGGNTADDETPYLDSLPSTPRAGDTQEVEETPKLAVEEVAPGPVELQNAYMAEANASAVHVPTDPTGPGGQEGVPSPLNPGGRSPLT